MKHYFILTALLVAVFTSAAQPASTNNLPKTRPADFSLAYHFDGGMRYHFEDIFISPDSCIYRVNEQGQIISRKFFISAAGLDSLYAILIQNRFNEIEYENKGMVYDRGGKSMIIKWDNDRQWRKVSDAQSHFVASAWKYNWSVICDYIINLAYTGSVKKQRS